MIVHLQNWRSILSMTQWISTCPASLISEASLSFPLLIRRLASQMPASLRFHWHPLPFGSVITLQKISQNILKG